MGKSVKFMRSKDSRSAWRERTMLTHDANMKLVADNKLLMVHNIALAKYAGQCEKALQACLASCAETLEGMLLIITPGQKRAKESMEAVCRIAAPFAADLPKEVIDKLIPTKVMPYVSAFLKNELIDRPKEVLNAIGGSEEAPREVASGGAGDQPDSPHGSE